MVCWILQCAWSFVSCRIFDEHCRFLVGVATDQRQNRSWPRTSNTHTATHTHHTYIQMQFGLSKEMPALMGGPDKIEKMHETDRDKYEVCSVLG